MKHDAQTLGADTNESDIDPVTRRNISCAAQTRRGKGVRLLNGAGHPVNAQTSNKVIAAIFPISRVVSIGRCNTLFEPTLP